MCWLMTFLGGLSKILVRNSLPFTRMCIGRRQVWGRMVGRRVRESCGLIGDGPSGYFDKRYLQSCLALADAVAFNCCAQKRICGHGVGRGGGSERDHKVDGASVFFSWKQSVDS